MYSESYQIQSHKDLEFSVGRLRHQEKIRELLRLYLPKFADEFSKEIGSEPIKEDYISRELVKYFNGGKASEGVFLFDYNEKNGPDFLIFVKPYQLHSEPINIIEAKRLPPTSSQDYVRTGIGRFKTLEHGSAKHNNVAMLGYVQCESFDHWYGKVNQWISVLVDKKVHGWCAADQLEQIAGGSVNEYRSVHERKDCDSITIYHFWIYVCSSSW